MDEWTNVESLDRAQLLLISIYGTRNIFIVFNYLKKLLEIRYLKFSL